MDRPTYSKESEIVSTGPYITRLKVPGGWLVCGENVIFLPDKNHDWILNVGYGNLHCDSD